MLITLLSLIVAALINYFPIELNQPFLANLMIIVGTTLLFLIPLLEIIALLPISQMEQSVIPRLSDLFKRDKFFRWTIFYLFLIPFISYLIATFLASFDVPYKKILIGIWIVLFGIALDLIRIAIRRVLNFLSPAHVIDIFEKDAKKAIVEEKDERLWREIDALTEMAVRAIDKSSLAISSQAINTFPPLLRNFFGSSKSIGRVNLDQQVEKKTGLDEAGYTSLYILQRLQLIHDKAVSQNLETLCNQIIVALGKISVNSANFDISMVSLPTYFLGQFAVKDIQHGMDEEGNLATTTLMEVAKTILTKIDVTYQEILEPFQTIIHSLNLIAKELFKNDKTINLNVLTQPFKELKQLFETEKMASQQDTPAIIQTIDAVLNEFGALEKILKTIPPIPSLQT